jgi:hypothetical protein
MDRFGMAVRPWPASAAGICCMSCETAVMQLNILLEGGGVATCRNGVGLQAWLAGGHVEACAS